MRLPFLSLVFTLLAVSAVLLAAILDLPELAALPIGLVLVYVMAAVWASGGRAEDLEWFADSAYFLGYISTITAFAGVVLRAWISGDGIQDSRAVLLMGGVALLTTVAGLIGMTFLRAHARVLDELVGLSAPARGLSASSPPSAAGTVDLVPISAESAAFEARGAADAATATIERLAAELRELNSGIARLHELVHTSNPEVEALARNVTEMQSVLDGFVAYLGSTMEAGERRRAGERG